MKETPLSNCEKEFILKAIEERKRLDGREIYDYRRIKISFGVDRGCCQVTIGNTRVLAQVSCEVTTPKQTRPSEGILYVNVELSPMASPQFEAGRQSDEAIELNRQLECCLKESRCVDTESLCIMSGVKVWQIRCDVHVLNHDGNMLDCASVAAITALAHFRRPDVTVNGEEVTIHSTEDRDPLPLSVHHMPLCVTFAFYHQGKFLLLDPSLFEERVMEGKLLVGMNKHREICTLQMTGSMLLLQDQVLRCSNIAVVKVTELTQLIQQALQNDTEARAKGEKFGFAISVETKKVTTTQKEPSPVSVENIEDSVSEVIQSTEGNSEDGGSDWIDSDAEVEIIGEKTARLGEGGISTWNVDCDDDMIEEITHKQKHKQQEKQPQKSATIKGGELSGESEEEEIMILGEDLQVTSRNVPVLSEQSIDLTKALKGNKKKKKKKT